jgi:transposase
MADIHIPHRIGRPRTRPAQVLADKAYANQAIRRWLRGHHITATIPVKNDQTANRRKLGSRGGRPPVFDRTQYRRRNTVERAINKLKQFRAVATRYDKRDYMYQATLDVATIKIWLRDLTQRR